MPLVVFAGDQPEDGWLEDVATGRTASLDLSSDRPRFGAYTPGLDAMLALGDDEGPVIDSATGLLLFDIRSFPQRTVPVEGGRGRCDTARRHFGWGAAALVYLGERQWRVLLPSGVLGEIGPAGAGVRRALSRPCSAAAFSPDGAVLALAEGRRVRILDLSGCTVETLPRAPTGTPRS